MKRALISVYDKTNVVAFAKDLISLNYEIISTGGTKKILEDNGISTIGISEITKFPEIMNGRVKTLHPSVHAALLCVRTNEHHLKELQDLEIDFIDLVCVNLYPFSNTLKKENVSHEEIIENIDIGGPSMLRSAAKNYQSITVLSNPLDYEMVINEIKEFNDTTLKTRAKLAAKVFSLTASYDAVIADYLNKKADIKFPDKLTLTYEKQQNLRYGENPHQDATFYKSNDPQYAIASTKQLHGKELSYNNIQDANACIEILKEFKECCAVGLKHTNPCGVGVAKTIDEAWDLAYNGDTTSIFGGIVAFNGEVEAITAKKLSKIFLEIIIAPKFSLEAFEILSKKKNIRLLQLDTNLAISKELKVSNLLDGILLQDQDLKNITKEDLSFPTVKKPTELELEQLLFAYKIVKHVKSNAIVLVKDHMSVGIGAGQMNRVGAVKIALDQAKEKANNSFLASDAFFPMADSVELAIKKGVKAIIQPGGSIKDQDSIDVCNKHNIAMVFTGTRHFKH
ncbi:MAG: bifunctional phosphoribosylaminoimidazolecarboxamide formyltransferase/IMP cyclohydrolase [Anaerorhabdus sp.]